jgi:hypothetical protein
MNTANQVVVGNFVNKKQVFDEIMGEENQIFSGALVVKGVMQNKRTETERNLKKASQASRKFRIKSRFWHNERRKKRHTE